MYHRRGLKQIGPRNPLWIAAVGALGGGGIAIDYIINEQFTTSDAAPITSPRSSEPGPGTLTSTDTGNRMSITGNGLEIASGGAYNDPVGHFGAVSKTIGLAIGFTVMQDVDASEVITAYFGYDDNNSADLREHRFRFNSIGGIDLVDGSPFSFSYNQVLGSYARLTLYNLALIVLDTQVVAAIKGGTWTSWTMAHKATRASTVASTLYPAINSYARDCLIKEIVCAVLPTWSDGDSVVSNLNDGDPITGGARSALDAFFRYERRLTQTILEADFS